ncbi:hypothetical protein RvY_15089 [Ramazzottius varieornatus]|uniref:Reverse transcriptase domain-containing protein n=1 Tax=Ramazzottius varieornatus TaxID=947166 RepID=A0A1D1VTN4_RAMVA|nr:hypothetical protein RvY_15089 [Ramazzottius varieornatus]
MQLVQMYHHFSQVLLQRKEADGILLDCTKVSGRIPHDVIVDSHSKHGVTGRLLALFSDYLRGRSQRVMVDGYFSDDQPVKSGVPQGSVLGPTFFTVAVNSLSTCVKSTVLQYADDDVLHRTVSSKDDCRAPQEDLDNLAVWCRNSGLDISSRKSQHLRISNKKKKTEIPGGSYKFASDPIPAENEGECLGVTYSSRLDWTPRSIRQLENIQKKFLRSIRLSKMETTDSHDTDFIQYRQHLAEVQWLPL